MFQHVVVAYDGSHPSLAAFDCGLEIAARFQADLRVVSVVRLPEPAGRVEIQALVEEGQKHFEDEFAQLAARAAERGVALRTEVLEGHPAEQIIRAAEREPTDLVVMGRRGISTVQRWLLGSISERVARDARCAVLIVHGMS